MPIIMWYTTVHSLYIYGKIWLPDIFIVILLSIMWMPYKVLIVHTMKIVGTVYINILLVEQYYYTSYTRLLNVTVYLQLPNKSINSLVKHYYTQWKRSYLQVSLLDLRAQERQKKEPNQAR